MTTIHRTTLKFSTKKMHEWGRAGVPTVLHPAPPKSSLFNRTFLKAYTFLLGFMVLINVWVTGPSHSPEFLEFCPGAWIRLGKRPLNTCSSLSLLLPDLNQYLFASYTPTAASCSQNLSLSVSWYGLGVGGKWSAGRMMSLGMKYLQRWEIQPFMPIIQFQPLIFHIFNRAQPPIEKSINSSFKIFHSLELPTLPAAPSTHTCPRARTHTHTHTLGIEVRWDD
jgi:hypothetical protein